MWVELKGPRFSKRCYGFWNGGQTFRIRIMALEPGTWSRVSGSEPSDPGLSGKSGSFQSIPWKEGERRENPNRRGIPRATGNGHALEWGDGTPYFIVGDYFYPASTTRYIWRASDESYPVDSPRAGFKDILKFRKSEGFNMSYVISSFPNWGYDGWPATLRDEAAHADTGRRLGIQSVVRLMKAAAHRRRLSVRKSFDTERLLLQPVLGA